MNFADLRFYKKNGYLVKKNLINKNIINNINEQIEKIALKALNFLNQLL